MFPPVSPLVFRLILLNVGVYLIVNVFGQALPFNPYTVLSLWFPTSENFLPIQLVSHFFMHSPYGLSHLLLNMFMLYIVGPAMEDRLGARNFLILYFGAAFGSMLLHLGVTWWEISDAQEGLRAFLASPNAETFGQFFQGEDLGYRVSTNEGTQLMRTFVGEVQNDLSLGGMTEQERANAVEALEYHLGLMEDTPMLGASGAIFGVAAAFIYFYPFREMRLLFIPIGFPAWVLIGAYIAYDVVQGFFSVPGDNVAHFAHLGGAIVGFGLAYVFSKQPPKWMKRIN